MHLFHGKMHHLKFANARSSQSRAFFMAQAMTLPSELPIIPQQTSWVYSRGLQILAQGPNPALGKIFFWLPKIPSLSGLKITQKMHFPGIFLIQPLKVLNVMQCKEIIPSASLLQLAPTYGI